MRYVIAIALAIVALVLWLGHAGARDEAITRVVRPPRTPSPASSPRLPTPPPTPVITLDDDPPPAPSRARRYHGWVVDAGGLPVEGAQVSLCAASSDDELCADELESTTTSADGSFSIPWPPAPQDDDKPPAGGIGGTEEEPRDAPPARLPTAILVEKKPLAAALRTGRDVELAAGPGLRVALAPAPRVLGRVLGPDGHPFSDARVGWYLTGTAPSFANPINPDDEGRFELTDLPSAPIVVFALGYDDFRSAATAPVDLREARGDQHVELQVSGASSLEVSGRVVDGTGRPLAMVAVTAEPPAALGELDRLRLAEQHRTHTSDDGTFRLRVGAPGRYRVELWSLDAAAQDPLAEAELTAVPADTPPTPLVVAARTVRCSLRDEAGRPVVIESFVLHYEYRLPGGTSGGGGTFVNGTSPDSTRDSIDFPWPTTARSMRVRLYPRARTVDDIPHRVRLRPSGIELRAPTDPCIVTAPPRYLPTE